MVKRLIGFILCVTLVASLSISPTFAAAKTTTVNATLSNMKITFNGQTLPLLDSDGKSLQPIMHNGNIFVPLRSFANSFLMQISYDSNTGAVNLEDKHFVINMTSALLNKYDTFDKSAIIYNKLNGEEHYKIDRTKLNMEMKNFKKVLVYGLDSNSINTIVTSFLIILTKDLDLNKYDDNNGFIHTTMEKNKLVFLLDDKDGILGFSILSDNENNKKNQTISITTTNNVINFNGSRIQFDKELSPIAYNGNTYIPIKKLAEKMEIGYTYDSKKNIVDLVRNTEGDVNAALNKFYNSFKVFSEGINVPKYKLSGHKIKIDQSKLPEDLKNFKKISATGIIDKSEFDLCFLYYMLTHKYGVSDYNKMIGFNSGNNTQYEIVTLWDDKNDILGYHLLTLYDSDPRKDIIHPTQDSTQDNPVYISVDCPNYTNFSSSISLSGRIPEHYSLKVNRSSLPKSMQKFSKISVFSTEWISEYEVLEDIKEHEKMHYGVADYNEKTGYGIDNSGKGCPFTYNVVLLLDNNSKVLGYSVIKVDLINN